MIEIGMVRWFDRERGLGVIAYGWGIEDAIVRTEAVRCAGLTELRAGTRVRFDLVPSQDGDGRFEAQNLEIEDIGPGSFDLSKPFGAIE